MNKELNPFDQVAILQSGSIIRIPKTLAISSEDLLRVAKNIANLMAVGDISGIDSQEYMELQDIISKAEGR